MNIKRIFRTLNSILENERETAIAEAGGFLGFFAGFFAGIALTSLAIYILL